MCELMETLKDPRLVYKFQSYFGVEALDRNLGQDGTEAHKLTKDYDNAVETDNQKDERIFGNKKYKINNKFWYYLFCFATELGDIIFYALFIPFWFWNIDGAVGRRFIVVWAVVMYVGQVLKDIIKWPRPGLPAIQLQSKWSLEYGMPSTHAMVAVSMPFSFIYFSVQRYECPISMYYFIAFGICWASLICASRLYLGMHSFLDIIAGILLAAMLMGGITLISDTLDNFLLTDPKSPLFTISVTALIIVYYPNSEKWTPTRGDTTTVLASSVGLLSGAWLLYQIGEMRQSATLVSTYPQLTQPYAIFWTSLLKMGPHILLRTIIGLTGIVLTLKIMKWFTTSVLCTILRVDPDDVRSENSSLDDRIKIFVDLSCKYVTYSVTGFVITYFIPLVFKKIGIERPTYYSEV